MKRSLIACTLIASLLAGSAWTWGADDTSASASGATKTEKRAKQMPFRGKLSAVDAAAGTITLQGKEKNRTLLVTSATRINRDSKPTTLQTVKVGESVGGLAKATPSGEWEVVTLNVGIKPAKGNPEVAREEETME
jgi:hypothetical protein